MLSVIALTIAISFQTSFAQTTEPWPGITEKILAENDQVKIAEVTFAPGSVATWHEHPDYTVYALTDVTMKEEIKDKEPVTINLKAGQAGFSTARSHQTSNTGKQSFTVIVTEIKPKK